MCAEHRVALIDLEVESTDKNSYFRVTCHLPQSFSSTSQAASSKPGIWLSLLPQVEGPLVEKPGMVTSLHALPKTKGSLIDMPKHHPLAAISRWCLG